jgi:Uma2 family endonuclease
MFPNELSLDTTPSSTPDICIYPKRKLDIKTVEAKKKEPPLTAIEIISPSQTFNEIMHKVWDLYFPMGVKSAWIVVPEVKAIHVLLPNDQNLYFSAGNLKDPATGIEISIESLLVSIKFGFQYWKARVNTAAIIAFERIKAIGILNPD